MTTNELRYDGRVAIVTGAGRGIGREHALLLAARGAAVVVNDLGGEVDGTGASSAPADEVVAAIQASGGAAVASYASVADDDGPAAIVAAAIEAFGRVDIVINNAGNMIPAFFAEQTRDDFRKLFAVHVLGTMGMCQAAWPHFEAASYGRIVNTSSPSFTGLAGVSGYASMKGAITSLTKVLALEGAEIGIHVNAIAPSAWSRMAPAMPKEIFSPELAEQLRTTRDPSLVAPAAAYLVHESCDITGEMFNVGGGTVARYEIAMPRRFTSPALTLEEAAVGIEGLMTDATSDENRTA